MSNSIGVIGGVDGPVAIFLSGSLTLGLLAVGGCLLVLAVAAIAFFVARK